MDKDVEKVLKQRAENKCCVICGKNCGETNTPSLMMHHMILGSVEICEKHIKKGA